MKKKASKNQFQTVVADPPWMEKGGGKIRRGADKHYSLLSVPEVIKTITQCEHWDDVTPDAHFYLWVTNNRLEDGLHVMKALGFRYITNVAWIKNSMGLGQYFRGKHELCLFGTRGRGVSVRTDDKSITSIVESPKTTHSTKPDSFFDVVEKRSKGPYLEMFARRHRKGWTVWGDEVDS